jgi:hypothetical protein
MSKEKMPLILLGAGVIVVLVAIFMMRGRNQSSDPDANVPELPFSQRPYTSLVPTEDGHYLTLHIENINVPGAASMDYELYYDTSDGITQGVPGKVTLEGKESIERELLLGSESSGKFRYDEGVDDGTLTLRFRDEDGKTIGKVAGQWAFYGGTDTLGSLDGNFKYILDSSSEAYFVVMPTFGVPKSAPGEVVKGPYGVFASTEDSYPGTVDFSGTVYGYYGSNWEEVSGSSDSVGVFISTN